VELADLQEALVDFVMHPSAKPEEFQGSHPHSLHKPEEAATWGSSEPDSTIIGRVSNELDSLNADIKDSRGPYSAAVGIVWRHMMEFELFASHQPAAVMIIWYLAWLLALHVCPEYPFREFVYYYRFGN
jgi:hypothetical protein